MDKSEGKLDKVVKDIHELVEDMLEVPRIRMMCSWSFTQALRTLVRNFAADSTTMRDKMLEAAQVVIRCQENSPATVTSWKLLGARGHEVMAAVVVSTGDEDATFTIWVVLNLDTGEVYCL